jgi:hypothetical protein
MRMRPRGAYPPRSCSASARPTPGRAAATGAGWRVTSVSEASQREWHDFESRYRAGREQWAQAHPEDPRAAPLAAEMTARREEYETVYRGVLGFAYLVLGA